MIDSKLTLTFSMIIPSSPAGLLPHGRRTPRYVPHTILDTRAPYRDVRRGIIQLLTVMSAVTWFHFVYVEAKSEGGVPGKARLQNYTAMLIGLSILLRLSALAQDTDPEAFRSPSATMLRIYGLQTSGSDWKLRMMRIEGGKFVRERFPLPGFLRD